MIKFEAATPDLRLFPHNRIERFAEAVAGEGETGFGFGEGQGEAGGGGFGPAEDGDGIDFGGGELAAFARPACYKGRRRMPLAHSSASLALHAR